jgi:hypothetical protein
MGAASREASEKPRKVAEEYTAVPLVPPRMPSHLDSDPERRSWEVEMLTSSTT